MQFYYSKIQEFSQFLGRSFTVYIIGVLDFRNDYIKRRTAAISITLIKYKLHEGILMDFRN